MPLCHFAILDIKKAFDSVSHHALLETRIERNINAQFIKYISSIFRDSSTRFFAKGWKSREIFPKRGVKQGDPLSGLLFNYAMDYYGGSNFDSLKVRSWANGL
jgi:retron-type reverse transcriptase